MFANICAPINLKMQSPVEGNASGYPILCHDSKNYSGIPVILTYLRKEVSSSDFFVVSMTFDFKLPKLL
uniref:Uncharacterized protein n=1 Tax=Trichobilharzia regenti TaxID=157069 RepID=A0AA85J039_TRIRE|nr:unnamed protein product [Trichobilharzia regenti]